MYVSVAFIQHPDGKGKKEKRNEKSLVQLLFQVAPVGFAALAGVDTLGKAKLVLAATIHVLLAVAAGGGFPQSDFRVLGVEANMHACGSENIKIGPETGIVGVLLQRLVGTGVGAAGLVPDSLAGLAVCVGNGDAALLVAYGEAEE